jgi:hypothetical protein
MNAMNPGNDEVGRGFATLNPVGLQKLSQIQSNKKPPRGQAQRLDRFA